MMRKLFATIAIIAGIISCTGGDPEADAQIYLTEARVMMQAGQYAAARDTIMALRRNFPTSFKTRAQAILVLDSIEFMAAEDSLAYATDERADELRLRAGFYRRKLEEDKKK